MLVSDAIGAYQGSLRGQTFVEPDQNRTQKADQDNPREEEARGPRVITDRVVLSPEATRALAPQETVAETPRVDGVEVPRGRTGSSITQFLQDRNTALRNAQVGRELEQAQLRASLRQDVLVELGINEAALADASATQRFVFDRQIETALDEKVRRELADLVTREQGRSATQSDDIPAPVQVPGTAQLTAVGDVSASDVAGLSLVT